MSKAKNETTSARKKITAGRKRAFIAALAVTGNISQAAVASQVNRKRYYKWCKSDLDFADAAASAIDEAIDDLEAEAVRRAKDGVEELVLHQGKPVMVDDGNGGQQPLIRKRYSDLLLIFMLKAARPQKYAHFRITENTGKVAHTHKDIRDLPPDQQHERMDEYLRNHNRLMGNDVDGPDNN